MSDYNTLEQSTQSGDPVYRFLFVQGDTEYRYTSAAYFISDSNDTWEPVAIETPSISQSDDMTKDGIKFVLPRDNDFAKLFLGGVPEQIASITVFRNHDSAPTDFQTIWKGRVAAASAAGDKVTIECENIFTSMRRPGLRARYQKVCRHALYSTNCGVLQYDYATIATATAASGFTVVVSGTLPDGYYIGGMLEDTNGYLRYISGQSGSTLTLMQPLGALITEIIANTTATVTLYPGCAHNTTDCLDRFNNLLNFGGFPWIPGKNPFTNNVNGSVL
jgi:uncharacterized phage protein (TIGR02218 family)